MWKTLGKRRRLNTKKLGALRRVIFQVEFSLLLAFLGPLEGSAVEKVRRTSLQYPTTQEAVYLCNRFPLPAEYVTVFSGRTDAPEVRCDLTDPPTHPPTHTHTPTPPPPTHTHRDPTTVTLAVHTRQGLTMHITTNSLHQ